MTLTSRDAPEECATYENINTVGLFEDQQKVRGYGSSRRYQVATGVLGLISAALLMAVIGMAVQKNDVNGGQSSLNTTGMNREQELQSQLDEANAQGARLQSQIKDLEEKKKEQDLRIVKLGTCKSCPPDWKALNHSCFYFSPPRGNMRKGWDGSRADCVQRGADLAIVDTLEKQTFISKIVNAGYSGRHETFNFMYGFWIGLREKVNEQTSTWIDGSLLTEGYWRDGEPNNYESRNEDCVATHPTDNLLKSWNDASCSHELGWICQKEATGA